MLAKTLPERQPSMHMNQTRTGTFREEHETAAKRAEFPNKNDIFGSSNMMTKSYRLEHAKYKAAQAALPRVHWGDKPAENCWQFEYLGSIFEAGGDQMPDARAPENRHGKAEIWENAACVEQ